MLDSIIAIIKHTKTKFRNKDIKIKKISVFLKGSISRSLLKIFRKLIDLNSLLKSKINAL